MKRLALLPALVLLACGETATEPTVDQRFAPAVSLLEANEDSQGQVLIDEDVGFWVLFVYDTSYDPAAFAICELEDVDDSWPDWLRVDADDRQRMLHIRVAGSFSLEWLSGRPEGAPEGGEKIGKGHATYNGILKSDGISSSVTEIIVGQTATHEIRCKRVSNQNGIQQYSFEWGPLEE